MSYEEYEVCYFDLETKSIKRYSVICCRLEFIGNNVIMYDEHDKVIFILNQFISISKVS